MSIGEEELARQLSAYKIPFNREVRFHPVRRWRFDFVVQGYAVEIEGGVYRKSRHTTGNGYTKDCEKYNEAALMGWRVLRFTTEMVKSGKAIDVILRAPPLHL